MRFCIVFVLLVAVIGQSHASVSKQDAKAARDAFKRGVKFEHQKHYNEAFSSFEDAARLNPQNTQYITAREMMRQKLVSDHLKNGNSAVLLADESGKMSPENRRVQAMAEFQSALNLDPTNDYAAERLQELVSEEAPASPSLEQITRGSEEIRLRPSPELKDIHFRGDSRALMTRIADLYGLTPIFDDNFTPLAVSLEMSHASFEQAIAAATPQSHAMWTPLSDKEIFFANDTPDNRRQYDQMILRTFYVSDVSSPEAMTDLVSLLRSIYDIRYVVSNATQSTIIARAPRSTLDAAATFINSLNLAKPQVMLDVRTYEINQTLLSELGVTFPTQFQMINVPTAALTALANQPNIQNQIQQIIQNGGLTPQNQDAINALLAQLQNQQNSQLSQLLKQPFALFGGGKTTFAVVIPPVTANFTFNQSSVINLEHLILRAAQGDTATLRVGDRFPIQNAIYAPIVSNPLLNLPGSQVSTFPSFSYEDLGITLKAKPIVHMRLVPNTDDSEPAVSQAGDPGTKAPAPRRAAKREEAEVTLDLDLSIRSLGGQSFNNVPVISNHQYTGTVRLMDGESALVVGSITRDQQRSLSGLPFFSRIFGVLTSNNNKNNTEDEILVVVTPYIVRGPNQMENPEQWLPPGSP
jgi:general secretion pathway protein D